MTISEFTMRFFKNGQEVTEANAGEIIDVELEGTFDVTLIQEKEIYNFDLNMDDIDFQNATYVDGSLTNALGTTTAVSGLGFLAPFDNVGGRRSLTHKIKFKIKLDKAMFSFNKTSARLSVAGGHGFYFNNDTTKTADTNKFFYIKIKQKMTTAEKAILLTLGMNLL